MRKRLTALTVALATIPMAIAMAASAAPASAAPGPNCGAYPSGQAFGIAVSQTAQQIRRGGGVTLFVNLTRGGEACSGRRVNFYVHGFADWSRYAECRGSVTDNRPRGRDCRDNKYLTHFSRSALTDANGQARTSYTNVLTDFRWAGFYYTSSSEAVRVRAFGGSQSGPLGTRSGGRDLVDVIGR